MKNTKKNTKVKQPRASKPVSIPTDDFNSSTAKSSRRQELLKTVAVRLTNDPTATWSDVGTAFTQALLEKKWEDNITEDGIRVIIGGILAKFSINNREILKAHSAVKSPADVQAALKASRGRRGKK